MQRPVMESCLSFVLTLAIAIYLLPQSYLFATAIILIAVVFVILIASFFNKKLQNFLSIIITSAEKSTNGF